MHAGPALPAPPRPTNDLPMAQGQAAHVKQEDGAASLKRERPDEAIEEIPAGYQPS